MDSKIETTQQQPATPAVASKDGLSGVKPSLGLFCVCDPNGILVHPTISLKPETAIEEWLEQEGSANFVVNLGRQSRGQSPRCRPSWEQFEAEGYRVIPVQLIPEDSHADNP